MLNVLQRSRNENYHLIKDCYEKKDFEDDYWAYLVKWDPGDDIQKIPEF